METCALEPRRLRISSSAACLHSCLEAADLIPDLESTRTFPAVLLGTQPMTAWAKVLTDRPEGREKALSVAGGLETAQRAFALTRRLMRVFGAVVEALVLAVLHARHDLLVRAS